MNWTKLNHAKMWIVSSCSHFLNLMWQLSLVVMQCAKTSCQNSCVNVSIQWISWCHATSFAQFINEWDSHELWVDVKQCSFLWSFHWTGSEQMKFIIHHHVNMAQIIDELETLNLFENENWSIEHQSLLDECVLNIEHPLKIQMSRNNLPLCSC